MQNNAALAGGAEEPGRPGMKRKPGKALAAAVAGGMLLQAGSCGLSPQAHATIHNAGILALVLTQNALFQPLEQFLTNAAQNFFDRN
jgi:hypothetical protein